MTPCRRISPLLALRLKRGVQPLPAQCSLASLQQRLTAAGRSLYRGLNAPVGGWGGGEEAEQEGHLADGEGLSWSNFTKKLRGELMLQISQHDLQTIWAALDEADDGCVTARAFLYQLKCTRAHTPFQARTLPDV